MTQQSTLMLIADIAGYTRFMKFHQASLAHAQEIVARLLEVVIDAAGPSLRLAKLEGDAAFFYMPVPKGEVVKRGLRLLQERKLAQVEASFASCLQRQGAGRLVK